MNPQDFQLTREEVADLQGLLAKGGRGKLADGTRAGRLARRGHVRAITEDGPFIHRTWEPTARGRRVAEFGMELSEALWKLPKPMLEIFYNLALHQTSIALHRLQERGLVTQYGKPTPLGDRIFDLFEIETTTDQIIRFLQDD